MHNEYLPLSNPRLGVAKEIIEVALCGAQWWVCACGVHPSYGLPLGAIIQSYSLSYPALSAACLPIYFPACTYVPYTRHGVPPSRYNKLEQVTFAATAAYTHTAFQSSRTRAASFINLQKRTAASGRHVGVKDRRRAVNA